MFSFELLVVVLEQSYQDARKASVPGSYGLILHL